MISLAAHRPTESSARVRAVGALAVVVATASGLVGCPHKGPVPEGQDPEKFSRAEYDVARDEWKHARLRSAMDHAQRASAADEGNAEAHNFVALLYMAICQDEGDCRWSEAEKFARKAVAADGSYLDGRHTLGSVLLQQSKWDEAITVLDPLAKDILYKTPELAWYDLGAAYLGKGQPDQAIEALSRAIALKPTFCWVHWRMGLAFEKKGDFARAEDELGKAVEPEAPACRNLQDAYEARARVRKHLGKCDDAKADAELCVKLAPSKPAGRACAQTVIARCP
jgi:type IV pilus assembly protein PilF